MRGLLLFLAAVCASAQNQTLECGTPTDAELTVTAGSLGPPAASFNIDAQQGDAVYVRVVTLSGDRNFQLSLSMRSPFGLLVNPRTTTASSLLRQGGEYDLPQDGRFTLRVQSNNTAGTISVQFVRLNRPCSLASLRCGQSASGQIKLTGQMDSYQFPAHVGEILSIRVLKTGTVAVPFDPNAVMFLALYGPDGQLLTTTNGNPAAGPNGNPSLPVTRGDVKVLAEGPLTIVVFENSGSRGGLYYVSAVKLNGGCGGPALKCGVTVDGQIASPASFSSYTIQAAAGDTYLFRVARSDTFGSFAPSAEIYDAQGTRVGVAGPVSPIEHSVAPSLVLIPANGTYTVLVAGPLDGSTGAYSLSAARVNKPCEGGQMLGCSSAVDGVINGLLRANTYSLEASANDIFLLRLLRTSQGSLFRPRVDIYTPNGALLQFVNTNDLERLNFTATSAGVYTMLVYDSFDGAQPGAYALSLLRLNRPCNGGTLSCGVAVAGSFARSLEAAAYTYNAAPGESFSVRMMDTASAGAGGLQPSVEVYDASGNLTGQNFSGNSAAVDVVKPAGGTYTVVALDSSRSPAAGQFALALLRTRNACALPSPQGQTVNGVVSGAAPLVSYSLPVESGDALSVRSASFTPGFAARMELYDPEGVRLDSGVFSLARKVTAAGTYTLVLGAAAARTGGAYALSWQLLNRPAAGVPLACGGSATASLAASNQFRYYTIGADAGDILRLIFTRLSENFAPQIELFDPAGARVISNSDVTQKAASGGSYLIVVSPGTATAETGSFTLVYQRPNNPCSPVALTCGQTTLRQVNLPGQLDTFTFNGTAGDLTTLRLASRSGAYSPFVEFYNAAGTRLSTSSNGLLRSVLTSDGVYTLLVRDRAAVSLGSYRVSLQDESSPCAVNDTEPPVLALLRPTGGEVLPGGATFRIQWQSDDNVAVASQEIALSLDGGKTFASSIASNLGGNAQSYDWTPPADVAPSRTAVIRVTATDAAGNAQTARSDLLSLIGSGFTPNSSATYSYDALDRLIQATLSDGRTLQYTWDAAGNLVQITISGQ